MRSEDAQGSQSPRLTETNARPASSFYLNHHMSWHVLHHGLNFSTNRGTTPTGSQHSPLLVPRHAALALGATMCDTQAGVPSA